MGKVLQMLGVLVGICLVSGFALGGLNQLTNELYLNNVLKYEKVPALAGIHDRITGEAMGQEENAAFEQELLEKKTMVSTEDGNSLLVFTVPVDGEPYAVAFETAGKGGFGGDVGVMTAFNIETGNLAGAGVTTHAETPGIGSRIKDDLAFLGQFKGMSTEKTMKLKKDGGAIDGISGATFSSLAVADGVRRAVEVFEANQETILGAAQGQ